MRIFISHSGNDRQFADDLVELLRTHYLDTWYSPRDIPAGYWEEQIREGLEVCDWFIVILSPSAMESDWVRREVELALADPRYKRRIVPVLAASCAWQVLHPFLSRYQLFDFTSNATENRTRLLRTWDVELHVYPHYRVGDVQIPVYIFVGGDGRTRFASDDIVCDGPGSFPGRAFELPDDLKDLADGLDGVIARKEREARERNQIFVNNRQVRLMDAAWGGPNATGGIDNRPLRLTLGWTMYYHTVVTNMNPDLRLPDGLTVGLKYQSAVDDLVRSRLSNPLAVNLTVVTSDGWIYVARRSDRVAWNTPRTGHDPMPAYQPAISGAGQAEDLDRRGDFDPFGSAIREGTEEATGLYTPARDQVTFFGLARTFKSRFPFLFGEIRVPLSRQELESYRPTKEFEGTRLAIPFTVEGVTDWIRDRYRDQVNRRLGGTVGTTLFALLQSLLYEYPDRWIDVNRRLRIAEGGISK